MAFAESESHPALSPRRRCLAVAGRGALFVALAACGCTSTPGGPQDASRSPGQPDGSAVSTPRLCDGMAAMKLRVFVEPQNGREERGSVVRVENGFTSLAFDGMCSYWMGGSWVEKPNSPIDNRDLGWRTGTLPPAIAQEIEQSIPLDRLDRLQDCVSSAGLFDAPTRTFRSRASRARCIRGGARFEAAWNFVKSKALDLWSAGTPLAGDIRLSAVADNNPVGLAMPYRWPLAEPLQPLLIREDVREADYMGFSSGISHLIAEAAGANLLRRIREQYFVDKQATPGFYPQMRMTDGKTTATVFLRDALPYEDERGLLPFSDPPSMPPP